MKPRTAVKVAPPTKAVALVDGLNDLSVRRLLEREESRLDKGPNYVATGRKRLDAALGGGLLVPSLTVLGAEPKCGKSTLVQSIAVHHVEQGGIAYYLDLENGRQRFLRRILCAKAELAYRHVPAALKDDGRGVFNSREALARWQDAKSWLDEKLGSGLFVEFSAPPSMDLEERMAQVAAVAGTRPFLAVIDSLQKLPTDYSDRRSSMDKWIRFFERLRGERGVFLVTSEIKRDLRGGYTAHASAFKESGGIEYAADLGLTMQKPDPDEELSTLRVEFARDADEDAHGDVASYRAVRPFYRLEELEPVACRRERGGNTKLDAAVAFLADLLGGGATRVGEVLEKGEAAGHSRATLYRAHKALNLQECTVHLKPGWRLP